MANVKIATAYRKNGCQGKIKSTWRHLRRLGEESRHNSLVGILKSQVVIGSALGGRLLGGLILEFRMGLLQKRKPPSQVW